MTSATLSSSSNRIVRHYGDLRADGLLLEEVTTVDVKTEYHWRNVNYGLEVPEPVFSNLTNERELEWQRRVLRLMDALSEAPEIVAGSPNLSDEEIRRHRRAYRFDAAA